MTCSTNTWTLADLLGQDAGRVAVSDPLRTRAIADAKRETDDIDAATLAERLAADYLPEVWQPDEATRRLRRLVSHRASLVRDRTAVRNRVTAILMRIRSISSSTRGLHLPRDEVARARGQGPP